MDGHLARWPARWLFLLFGALLALSCKSSLSTNLDGLACDANQRCLDGYTCDVSTNTCHATLSCRDGQTVCGSDCVYTKENAKNCGGCGATCTAPEHGLPSCTASRCGFNCEEGYTPCGTICVNLAEDPENCGGCGKKCSPSGGTP